MFCFISAEEPLPCTLVHYIAHSIYINTYSVLFIGTPFIQSAWGDAVAKQLIPAHHDDEEDGEEVYIYIYIYIYIYVYIYTYGS